MAKNVIAYLLEGDGSVPKFVQDGGYYPLNEELIGISVDSLKRHVPNTVNILTLEQLVSRLQIIYADKPEINVQELAENFFNKLNE